MAHSALFVFGGEPAEMPLVLKTQACMAGGAQVLLANGSCPHRPGISLFRVVLGINWHSTAHLTPARHTHDERHQMGIGDLGFYEVALHLQLFHLFHLGVQKVLMAGLLGPELRTRGV